MPVHSLDVDNVNVIALLVEKRIKPVRRTQRNVVFRRVSATNDGDVSLQILHILLSFLNSNVYLRVFRSLLSATKNSVEVSRCLLYNRAICQEAAPYPEAWAR